MSESKRGSRGGNARKEKLSPERRSEIAKQAAAKRWGNKDTVSLPEDHIEISYVNSTTGETSSPSPEPLVINESPNPIPVPFIYKEEPKPQPIPVPQPRKTRPKQMPKAFKGASSYAEKRLAEAIKERAEYMGRVAALNAEIPSLVQVIRALGTSTIPPEALQAYPPMMPSYAAEPAHNYPVDPMQNIPNPIDPALYAANSNPLPGLVPAAAQAPIIPNTSAGGAMDLDYVPKDEEGQGLPKMGGDWH